MSKGSYGIGVQTGGVKAMRYPPRTTMLILVTLYVSCAVLSFCEAERVAHVAYRVKFIAFLSILTLSALCMTTRGALRIPFRNRILFSAWFLWCISLLPAVSVSDNVLLASGQWMIYLSVGLLTCVIVPFWIRSDEDAARLIRLYMCSIAVPIGIVIAMMLIRGDAIYYINQSDGRVRYDFGFVNPNFIGCFAATVAVQWLQRYRDFRSDRLVYNLVFLVLVIGVTVATNSRASILFAGLYLVASLVLRWAEHHRYGSAFLLVTALLIVVLGFIAIVSIAVSGSPIDAWEELNRYSSGRLNYWRLVIQEMQGKRVLFGYGLRTPSESVSSEAKAYENWFVSHYVQTGLFGITGVTLVIIASFICASTIHDERSRSAATSLLVAWMAYCFFENAFAI